MNLLIFKILGIVSLLIGEAFYTYAEMLAAKNLSKGLEPALSVFIKSLGISTLAGSFLILGYMLGFKGFQNIWIITVFSLTSLLIIEPFLAYTIFHQIPTKGAIIGFILGIIGMVLSFT